MRLIKLCRPSASDGRLGDQPFVLEPAQQAANVAEVEIELGAELSRVNVFALREFVNDAAFGQGQRTAEQALVEQADLRV